MSDERDPLERTLDQLRAATDGLAPRPGLSDRLLARIAAEERGAPGFLEQFLFFGRRVALAAGIAALCGLVAYLRAEARLADAVLLAPSQEGWQP